MGEQQHRICLSQIKEGMESYKTMLPDMLSQHVVATFAIVFTFTNQLFSIGSLAHEVARPRPVATYHVVPQAAIADEEQGDDDGNVAGVAINAGIGDTVCASGNALNQLQVAQQERGAKDYGRIKVFLDTGLAIKMKTHTHTCVCV
jgi:hypothetical protein